MEKPEAHHSRPEETVVFSRLRLHVGEGVLLDPDALAGSSGLAFPSLPNFCNKCSTPDALDARPALPPKLPALYLLSSLLSLPWRRSAVTCFLFLTVESGALKHLVLLQVLSSLVFLALKRPAVWTPPPLPSLDVDCTRMSTRGSRNVPPLP